MTAFPPAASRQPPAASFPAWALLAALAWGSHILLDCANAYGTMVWQPFSDRRVAWNALPILDLPVTGLLLAAWGFGRLWRRLRARPGAAPARAAAAALALAAAYAAWGWADGRALEREARLFLAREGHPEATATALPWMLTNRLWRVVADDGAGRVGVAAWSAQAPRPLAFRWYPRLDPARWEAARDHPEVRRFLRFTQGACSAEAMEGQDRFRLVDRRHGLLAQPEASVFRLELAFDGGGRLAEARPAGERPRPDLGREAALLWRLYWTGNAEP